MKNKIIVIAGPTAVGKTQLSINLAKKLNTEIISADSMQIYKYMDIGSAKVTKEEMDGVKHHMIDIIDPSQEFSVAEYKEKGMEALDSIILKNKIPIIAGGTGLYINALTCNMNFSETEKDEEYRKYLLDLSIEKGNEYVHEMLKEHDIVSYNNIHPNNVKRVIRALEVYKLTGKPFSEYNSGEDFYKTDYDVKYYVLNMDRDKLYQRINLRVDIMMKNGLLDECKKLMDMGCNSSMQSMQGIGYKEILSYLEGNITLDEAVEMVKQYSRNYAKRQLTWFRRDPRAIFIDKDKMTDEEIEEKILRDLE